MTRRRAARWLPALCLFVAAIFAALGLWQVERLRWKLELIERVETRVGQAPVPAPFGRDPKELEYRPVRARGSFLHDRATLVQALTERGAGYWVMTPLRTSKGLILINRGFVPEDGRNAVPRTTGQVEIEGLLRLSEPNGRFLRQNRPAENRWYSRDVASIAEARGLGPIEPYFIDAGASTGGTLPVGGLTVVRFRNAHLIYALTWFALAALAIWGFVLTRRQSRGEKVP